MSNYYQTNPPPRNRSTGNSNSPQHQQQRGPGQSGGQGYRPHPQSQGHHPHPLDRLSGGPGPYQGQGQEQRPPRPHTQHQQQQLPPLRQPQQPTLNLSRDFASAEELLSTLEQFNHSYDIFNDFTIPTTPYPGENGPQGADGEYLEHPSYSNSSGGSGRDFQRMNSQEGVRQQHHPQPNYRHQLQNDSYTPEQREHLLAGGRRPHGNDVPPEVLGTVINTQGAEKVLSSFAGYNNGMEGQGQQFVQPQPQPYHPGPPQQQMNTSGHNPGWEQRGDDNNERPNDYSSPSSGSLGTSNWGPPPGAHQQPYNVNTSFPVNNGSLPPNRSSASQMNHYQSQPMNSQTYFNPNNSSSRGQLSNPNLANQMSSSSGWSPSINASEFVPKPRNPEPGVDTNALAMAVAQFHFPQQQYSTGYPTNQPSRESNQQNYYHNRGMDSGQDLSETNEEFVLQTLTDAINKLCASPAEFSRLMKETTNVLKQYLGSEDTLGIVITLIIEQSIATPNFRYSGARLCHGFHQSGIKVGDSTFKNVLLKRCEEEFRNCISKSEPDSENDRRAQGLLAFLGELYVNFQLVVNNRQKPIAVIGMATVELMIFLIQTERRNFQNIKSVAQVLKLLGWEFENSENESVRNQMETLMKDLSYILVLSSETDSGMTAVIKNLVELKKRGWDKTDESVGVSESQATSPETLKSNSYAGGATGPGPVFYELPDSDDDEDIDGRYLVLDDEPEDVCRFYEKFLEETEMKRRM